MNSASVCVGEALRIDEDAVTVEDRGGSCGAETVMGPAPSTDITSSSHDLFVGRY
jgi:hypothetical protein